MLGGTFLHFIQLIFLSSVCYFKKLQRYATFGKLRTSAIVWTHHYADVGRVCSVHCSRKLASLLIFCLMFVFILDLYIVQWFWLLFLIWNIFIFLSWDRRSWCFFSDRSALNVEQCVVCYLFSHGDDSASVSLASGVTTDFELERKVWDIRNMLSCRSSVWFWNNPGGARYSGTVRRGVFQRS